LLNQLAIMDVIPISFIDQLRPVPSIRTRTHFIVREHLDVELLRQSLDKLVRDHWRLLGARLATNSQNGELVYHLPKVFEDGYSLFGWSSEEVDKPIDDAVPALRRPAAEGVVLLPRMDEIGACFEPADWPTHRRHDRPDSPMIFVHVQSYADATVVSINFLHVLADQLGLVNIMKAWLGLAGGKEPPPMIGFDKDMFQPKRQFSDYAKNEISRKGMIKFKSPVDSKLVVLGLIPEFVYHPRERRHSVFFPLELIASLRETCAETLRNKYKTDNGISNADILTAILAKVKLLSSHRTAS
jgi:hypothetical protein